MEKARLGLALKIITRSSGKKILGEGERDEQDILCTIVETLLSEKVKISKEEIRALLRKDLRILFSEDLKKTDVVAFCNANNVVINKDTIDLALRNKTQKGTKALKTIIHEFIHKMQQLSTSYKGIKIVGIIEGATEILARRAAGYRPKSMSYENYRCNIAIDSYTVPAAIMSQIEVMFGKTLFENFALRGDTTLLKHMIQVYGRKSFKKISKNLNSTIRGNKRAEKCMEMQEELLNGFLISELSNVKNVEEAERLLAQLREIDNVRMHKNGDETFAKHYLEILSWLKQRFYDLDAEEYKYKEVEFYPRIYPDEQLERLDKYTLYNLSTNNISDFKKLDLNNYRRYRIINEQSVYEVITDKGKPRYFSSYDENCHSNRINLYDPKRRKEIAASNLDIAVENGQLCLSVGEPLIKDTVLNQRMEEIPLGVSEKDIYMRMTEILDSAKKKELPSFDELMREKNKSKENNNKWWELTIDNWVACRTENYFGKEKEPELEGRRF